MRGKINEHTSISHPYKYAYTQIFRSASTTITSALYTAETGEVPDKSRVSELRRSFFSQPSELTEGQLQRFLEDYFKFTFVRNPYSPVLSAYLFKFPSPSEARSKQWNERWERRRSHITDRLGKSPGAPITLTDFLDYLEFEDGIDSDAHWVRQSDLIAMPVAEYDMIGKLETFDHDVSVVFSRVFKGQEHTAPKLGLATGASDKLGSLNTDQLRRIYRLYEADFDNFGYPSTP